MQTGRMFIGGKWVDAAEGGTREILNPADNELFAVVADGSQSDADDQASIQRGDQRKDRGAAESHAKGKANWPVEVVERLEGDQSLIGQRSPVEHAVQGQVEDRRLQTTSVVSPAELAHVAIQMPGTEFVVVADDGALEQ